ncbi:hypothetical protein KKI19_03100 [Patescibacteria group bacterium]|nr:hypothetical protein [Patescibacteria group bacterium]
MKAAVYFILSFFLGLIFSELSVRLLSPRLYLRNKRIHHGTVILFYLFVVLPILVTLYITGKISFILSRLLIVAGITVSILIHHFLREGK